MLWLVTCIHVDRFGVFLTVSRSFNITLLQFGERFRASNTTFIASLFVFPSATRREKNMPVICCKKKKKYSKYRAFLIFSCDKLRSQLQSDWKRHKHYNQAPGLIQKRDKTQKSVDICKEFMLRTPKPCAPRTRKPQLYEQLFRSCMAFSVYEVVRVACQSRS